MLAFGLPGREEELQNSVGVIRKAMDYYSREFGSYPFGSYKAVFVEDAVTDVHNASTLTILSADLLHPPSVIDQALETRQLLAHALAVQWVGINIIQKAWSDTWLINGLSLFISGLFWRRLMGNNEYRFRLRKDCDRVCAWDIGMPPISQVGSLEPPDASLLPFINLKAPLVLHILDRRLCKAGASLGLGRVIPKVFLQAITGELPNNTLSTSSFLRTCRKVSGVDLRTFAEQWIYGSGCPRFFVSSHFNRKKLTIEIHVRQESPSAQFAEYRPELAIGSNPVDMFEGQMTIRIHEADGRPYEHVLDIKSRHKRYDVPFNTKYKRVRRNTKRFQARQAAAAAAAEGDQDAAEAMGMIDLGFSLAMWENEEQRERWKVADWTEEDEDIMSQAAYEWIRMDSDFEWIASLHVDQPDYMWVSQLQRDRDVVAQLQAVQALAQMPNAISSSMLTRTVLVQKYFFRIRIEAAHAIVNCAVPQLGYLGLFHLLMLFRTSFCIDLPEDTESRNPLDIQCVPRANDFAEPAEYFLKKALVAAICRVRNERGRTLPQIKKFLINLLKYNDNSTNRFVDDYYVAGLLTALASAFVPVDAPAFGGYVPANEDPDAREDQALFQHACAEVSRLQELDKLVPSFHNLVSLACLDWHASMVLSSQLPLDLQIFLAYTQQGTFTPVRIAAFNHILMLSGLKHRIIVRYLFAVLRSDENRAVKRALARGMCEALAIAIATGDAPGARQESIMEEDPAAADRARAKEMESTLRSLRREIGRSAAVREGFLGALLATHVDSEERWALLKIGEILFKPSEETDLPLKSKLSVRVRMTAASNGTYSSSDIAAPDSPSRKLALVNRAAGDEGEDPVSTPSATRVAFEAPEKERFKKQSVKLKKPKPVAQAQAAGMSSTDLTACRNALKKLLANKHAPLFTNPVDPVRDQAPDYHKIIKEPMDLSTMENKLEAGVYPDRFAFQADFELLVRNAKTYTPDPSAYVHKEAEALSKASQAIWTRTNKTLEQAAAKQARVTEGAESMPPGGEDIAAAPADGRSPSDATAGPMPPPPVPVRPTPVPSTPTPSAASPPAPAASKPLGLKLKLKPKAPAAPATPSTPVSRPAPKAAATPSTPVADETAPATEVEGSAEAEPTPSKTTPKPKVKVKPSTSGRNAAATPAKASPKPPTPAPATPVQSSLPPTESPAPAAPAVPARNGPAEDPGEDPVVVGGSEPIHTKQCKALLQTLKKVPEAFLFLAPVDEAYAPGYFSVVTSPMDLSTIESKLNAGKYRTMGEFAADMEQIFTNAYIYADLTAVQHADVLRAIFRKREWPRAMVRKLEYNERRALQGMLSRIKNNPIGGLFLQPIEEIVKALPHYYDVIPKERARDLQMISDKLKSDGYGHPSELDADVRLMIANANTFNAANESVLSLVASFEQLYNKEWRAAGLAGTGGKAGSPFGSPSAVSRKRKEGSDAGGVKSDLKRQKS